MKIRNRKLLNGVIATFLVVLMTGTALAFAAQGPLTFEGTAGVDASLALAIVQSTYSDGAELELTIPVEAINGAGHRAAAMSAEFDGPNQEATFSFVVQNIGTIPAEIAPIVLDLAPGSSPRLAWEHEGALETLGEILLPEEYVEFSFTVAFDAEGFEGWYYIATAGVSFVLNYGLVGSYQPAPTAVPVADISLTIIGGTVASPVTRVWTSFGTQGWEINPIPTADGGFNMSRARLTENQNSWHRSSQFQGRNAEDTENIPRPSVNPGNMGASILGLFPYGTTGSNRVRNVTFELTITLEDGTEVVIYGDYRWRDNAGAGTTPPPTGRLEFTTFTCETGRFELAMRGWTNNFEEWWLVDTSGVN